MRRGTAALGILATLVAGPPYEDMDSPSGAGDAGAPHTRARLVAISDAVVPGTPVDVAIVLESDPGWHTYWINPGDAGMATSVRWTLPDGWSAGELEWPAPARFREGDVATFGYEGTVWLISRMKTGPSRSGDSARLAARVEWLECREVCLPGAADVSLALPFRNEPGRPLNAAAFAAARAKVPAPATGWRVVAAWTPARRLALGIRPPEGTRLAGDTLFFPERPGVLDPSGSARLTGGAEGEYSLELSPARLTAGAPPPLLEGVLVSGGRSWRVRVSLPPKEN